MKIDILEKVKCLFSKRELARLVELYHFEHTQKKADEFQRVIVNAIENFAMDMDMDSSVKNQTLENIVFFIEDLMEKIEC